MANVIRQDVVQLDFQIEGLKELTKLQEQIDELKKKITGLDGADELDGLKKNTEETVKPFKKVKEQVEKVTTSLTDMGRKAATVAFNGLKKVAGVSFKALAVSAAGAATAIGKIAYEAAQSFGEYEQLKGGIEKIFDEANINQITKDANNAYKDLGLSANEYMSTINDTGATFAAVMGDQKGYDTARTGLLAISNYASGTGKDINLLSEKFTLITRSTSSYQSIADQFSGILPATSKDFLAQAQAAGLLGKSYSKLTDVPIAEYQQAVAKMLEKGVKDLGLAGNTLAEAEGTVTGSAGMMKAAWGNLLVAVGSGDNLDQAFENMVSSAEAFAAQMIPVISRSLENIGLLIERISPIIADKFPQLAEDLIPPLIKAAIEVTKGLINALPSIVKTVFETLVDICGEQFPILKSIFGNIADFFKDNAGKITKAIKIIIPVVLGLIAAFKLFNGIKAVTSIIGSLGKGGGKGGKGGIFKIFQNLAKMKTTTVLKGMANLAIIFGGLMILAAAFMAVAPYMAQLSDVKSMFEVIAVVGVLGLVGTGLAKLGEIAGKIPVATVAKGLANMAIMIGGLTVLTAAFMFVAPYIAELSNSKAVFKVIGIMTVLGLVGTALSIFAGIAGMIPIPLVLSGLANMAIMLVGLTALTAAFMLVAPDVAALAKSGDVFKVIGIMTALGLVGTVLTVFAGIAGVIPIPVVLAGLANMALVLGGITALIVAFGALSQIQGFDEFIESGGALLSKIMGVIGEMAGSLISGIGEGLTNSLPAIGENLAQFGKNVKPLFEAVSGVDMGGVGAFFTSLVGLLGIATGNDIIQGIKAFFGGEDESPLVKLGNDLTNFANNAQGFFTKVAEFPENGFTNATKLFDTLAGLKSLPKDGGVVGWFTGEINFTTLAAGLGQLASENVINFFNSVSTIKENAFNNAALLFDTLAGLKKLPNDGGVVGWFAGNVNYTNIADGLTALGKTGVKNFFTMTGGLNEKAFTNTTKMFEALAGMEDLPKEGGFWQNLGDNITGEETKSKLSVIADDLSNFHEKTSNFFTQVNSLNVGKLNSLWESLKKPTEITTDISKIVSETIDDIVNKVSKLPEKMGESIRKSGGSLSQALVAIWKNAVTATATPVNKLISGANWILQQFGSDKRVTAWTPYAKGTSGHKGGNALVNDGRGAELVQMPNGNTFIPQGRNVFIPNAPKGMKVLSAEKTASAMGRKSPTFRYADGTGDIDIWSYMDNAAGLISSVSNKYVDYDGMKGAALHIGKGMTTTISGQMTSWAEKLFDEFGALSLAAYNPSKGVEQWKTTVMRALKMENQYSEANVKKTLYQMQTESGGNPRAINLWDSNAKKGIPSKGLMQVIDPTFQAYARAGFNKNIYDPLSNILASIRYALARYGTLAKAYRGVGYANGGIVTKPHLGLVGEAGNEAIIPLSMSKRKQGLGLWSKAGEMLGVSSRTPESTATYQESNVENNTYSPVFNLTLSGDSDRTLERKVKQWVKESMNEVFEGVTRRNPRIREI